MLPAKCQQNIISLEIYSNDCWTIGFMNLKEHLFIICVCEFIVKYDNGAHTQQTAKGINE